MSDAFPGSVSPVAPAADKAAERSRRDLRLDFFRGLALWFIFVDHIPNNAASWLTVRNFGFSDATEIFVFISGYSAMLAYGAAAERRGLTFATAQVLRRCWQIYIAHILLIVMFLAYIAYASHRFGNPIFAEEMGVAVFAAEPHVTLWQALLLKFKPVNLDVLPLYIVLLLLFPLILAAMPRFPLAVFAASVGLYAANRWFGFHLPAYPQGTWYFNPFAWQLLFVLGACCAQVRGRGFWSRAPARLLVPAAISYLVFALCIVITWRHPSLAAMVPRWLAKLLYPIDKTNLDILRVLHFLAMAYLVVRWIPSDATFLSSRWVRPAVLCGRHSLHVFCLGAVLSLLGQFTLVEIDSSLAAQIGVSALGVALMIALSALLSWYRRLETAPRASAAAAVAERAQGGMA